MTAVPVNRYCERLDIPVPRLADVVQRPGLTLSQLAVVALLEQGGPLSFHEIARRLSGAGLPARLAKADLLAALRKAWHGQPPLVRDTEDRLALDLLSWHLRYIVYEAGIRPVAPSPPARVDPPQPGDDEPLTPEEVTAAFSGRSLDAYSSIRRAAAVLEAWGSPQTLDDVCARLRTLTEWGSRIGPVTVRAWRTDLIRADEDSQLHLNPRSADAPAFRRDIRRKAAASLRAAAESGRFKARESELKGQRAKDERDRVQRARQTHRALLHTVPPGRPPLAAAVIDIASREVEVFPRDELTRLAERVHDFDFLAGVDLRPSLRALGLDPERWWLADLRPVQKTYRPTERSKALPVTLTAAVRETTGTDDVPADAGTWARRFDRVRRQDVADLVAHEARALCQFYEYGAFHGGVRLPSRSADYQLAVEWALPGDPDVFSTLDAAVRRLSPVDLILDAPPDLSDPWRGAVRADIADMVGPDLVIRTRDELRPITTHDIYAVRVADEAAAANIRPRHATRDLTGVCELTVTLDGIVPPIWRRLVVPVWVTLEQLHALLQTALGWTNSHLHMFTFGKERVGTPYELFDLDETYTRSDRILDVADLIALGHRRFTYDYDFGDGWRHTVKIEHVRDRHEGPDLACLDGARACPPEDCGGIGGYEHLLEVLFDPLHEEFESMREWVGPNFEPERFDLRDVNRNLRLW